MTNQRYLLAAAAAIALGACSQGSDAGTDSQSLPSVLIERERRFDAPQAHVQLIRETIESCQQARGAVMAAAGAVYDPRSEQITDQQILDLDTYKVLEAFEGRRYVKITTQSVLDRSHWGPGPGESCLPKAVRSKSMEIHTQCDVTEVSYDLDAGTGSRSELKGVCAPSARPVSADIMKGETMVIAGTQLHCRWTAPEDDPMGSLCLLEPWLSYPGTDRDLMVAMHDARPAAPSGALAAIQQAAQASEHPVRVEVGKPLPQGIFEVPADALQFGPPKD